MNTIDAVLPLLPKDVDRFDILAQSLIHFFHDLNVLHVVVPDQTLPHLTQFTQRYSASLPLHIVPESLWVPDLPHFRYLPGWYKQQLIKLAASEFITGDFYLTLDADVICTRNCYYEDLIVGKKAGCFVMHHNEHPAWYEGAEAVLGLKARRQGILHNVTPCLLATAGVKSLIKHINLVASEHQWASGWRGLKQRALFSYHQRSEFKQESPWRGWLAASWPWAEYALYFTFLECNQTFDDYHFNSNTCLYDVERSIWWAADANLTTWNPQNAFDGEGPPYFIVVQSNTHIPPSDVWKKVSPIFKASFQNK